MLLTACAVRAVGNVTAEGVAMPFSTVARGSVSGVLEPLQLAIRSRNEWIALWERHARAQVPPPPAPAVDFGREMVVGIFMGERATGGYEIEITRVERAGSHLRVYYRSRQPQPGAVLVQALSHPYHLIKLSRDDGPVVFLREGSSR